MSTDIKESCSALPEYSNVNTLMDVSGRAEGHHAAQFFATAAPVLATYVLIATYTTDSNGQCYLKRLLKTAQSHSTVDTSLGPPPSPP